MNTLLPSPVIEERTVISGACESFAKGWRWRRIAERADMTFGQDSAASDLRGAWLCCSPFSMRRKSWRLKGSITQVDNGDNPSAIGRLTADLVPLPSLIGKESDHPMTFLVRTDPQHVQITAEVSPESVQYSIASK